MSKKDPTGVRANLTMQRLTTRHAAFPDTHNRDASPVFASSDQPWTTLLVYLYVLR